MLHAPLPFANCWVGFGLGCGWVGVWVGLGWRVSGFGLGCVGVCGVGGRGVSGFGLGWVTETGFTLAPRHLLTGAHYMPGARCTVHPGDHHIKGPLGPIWCVVTVLGVIL